MYCGMRNVNFTAFGFPMASFAQILYDNISSKPTLNSLVPQYLSFFFHLISAVRRTVRSENQLSNFKWPNIYKLLLSIIIFLDLCFEKFDELHLRCLKA